MGDAAVVGCAALQHRSKHGVGARRLAVHHGFPDLPVQLPPLQQRCHIAHCDQHKSGMQLVWWMKHSVFFMLCIIYQLLVCTVFGLTDETLTRAVCKNSTGACVAAASAHLR